MGGTSPKHDSLRAADLTPTHVKQVPRSGNAPQFLSFLKKELIPYIESKFRTVNGDRTLMGSSYGGLFIVHHVSRDQPVPSLCVDQPDIGEWNDIHPLNKRDVGKRLALLAQKVAYGEEDVVCSGPLYQSMRIDGNKIILTFSHIGSGLVARGEESFGNLRFRGPTNNLCGHRQRSRGMKYLSGATRSSVRLPCDTPGPIIRRGQICIIAKDCRPLRSERMIGQPTLKSARTLSFPHSKKRSSRSG